MSRRTIRRKLAEGLLHPTRKLPGSTGAYLFDPDEVEIVFGPDDLRGDVTSSTSPQCTDVPAQAVPDGAVR